MPLEANSTPVAGGIALPGSGLGAKRLKSAAQGSAGVNSASIGSGLAMSAQVAAPQRSGRTLVDDDDDFM
jgi:hypothetical protein